MADRIEGVPEGWELLRIGGPAKDDWFIGENGKPLQALFSCGRACPIIRKVEKPAAYRPFGNAEEFRPHRDRWWYRDDKDERRLFQPQNYSDDGHGGSTWVRRLEECFFDDGTPFGVRIDE